MDKRTKKSNVKVVEKTVLAPDLGKLPPQAIELEEAVLGALLLEKDAYGVVNEILKPESFYNPVHQMIYEAIQSLAMQETSKTNIDMLTVIEELKRLGNLEKCGGAPFIAELTEKVASAAHIEYHARIIAQKHLSRQLINFSSHITQQAYDETVDVDDLMQETEGKLFEISQRNVRKDFVQIKDVVKDSITAIQIAGKREDGMSGLPTGFSELDQMTYGWQNSDLIIIAARPAMGKTAFILSMAKNMAVDYNSPVAIFSLEMSNIQLVNRLIVNTCQIPGDKIRSGKLDETEWSRLIDNQQILENAPIYVDDTPSLSIFELRTKARRLVREHGVKIIIIDYLQLMNASGMNFGSREQEVSMISRSLKGLAKELNIPMIALSQLNRGVENRTGEGKRPQLADLRESGAIEQDADIVCFIHRPEYYKITENEKGESTEGLAEIIVAKHRNGATGIANLTFEKDFARFANRDEYTVNHTSQQAFMELGSRINQKIGSDPISDSMISISGKEAPF